MVKLRRPHDTSGSTSSYGVPNDSIIVISSSDESQPYSPVPPLPKCPKQTTVCKICLERADDPVRATCCGTPIGCRACVLRYEDSFDHDVALKCMICKNNFTYGDI